LLRTTTSVGTKYYKLYILSSRKIVISNEVRFDELRFPYSKQAIIDQNNADTQTNILSRVPSGATWVPYDKSLLVRKSQTAHFDPKSDVSILRLVDKTDTYTKTTQQEYFRDVLSVQQAFVASLRVVQGLPDSIDPDKPLKKYKDAMSRPDNQEWAKAYMDEYLGFKERQILQQFRYQRRQKSWVRLRVSTTRSTMVWQVC
jgi:hypothetical protein